MQRQSNACAPNRQNGSTPKGQHATPPQTPASPGYCTFYKSRHHAVRETFTAIIEK